MGKLVQRGAKFFYNDKEYDKFFDAVCALAEDITWRQEDYSFKDINIRKLSDRDKKLYVALVAVKDLEFEALISSPDYKAYKKMTRVTLHDGVDLLNNNPFYYRNLDIPMVYQVNRSMQCAVFPAIAKVYDKKYSGMIKTARKSYKYDLAISYFLDNFLFNPKTTPFKSAMDLMIALDKCENTAGLSDYVSNSDLNRVKVLVSQVRAGDFDGYDDKVLLNNLRKGNYKCKSFDLWGDGGYVATILNLPPSRISDDYYRTLDNAGKAVGKDLHLFEEEKKVRDTEVVSVVNEEEVASMVDVDNKPKDVESVAATDTEDDTGNDLVKQMMDGWKNPAPDLPSDSSMSIAAQRYCQRVDLVYEAVMAEIYKEHPVEKDAFYALKNYKVDVNVDALVDYLFALHDYYGSTIG